VTERKEEHASGGDPTALLAEAHAALDAIRHLSMGLRPRVDPLAEAKRLHDAVEALYELDEQAFPGSRPRQP